MAACSRNAHSSRHTCPHPPLRQARAIARTRPSHDDQRVSLFWTLISICVAIIWVITLIDLFRRHLGAGPTAAWVLLVIVLPFVGALIYWIVRKPSTAEIEHSMEVHEDMRRDPQQSRMPPPP